MPHDFNCWKTQKNNINSRQKQSTFYSINQMFHPFLLKNFCILFFRNVELKHFAYIIHLLLAFRYGTETQCRTRIFPHSHVFLFNLYNVTKTVNTVLHLLYETNSIKSCVYAFCLQQQKLPLQNGTANSGATV
jgi:hypothetical protein